MCKKHFFIYDIYYAQFHNMRHISVISSLKGSQRVRLYVFKLIKIYLQIFDEFDTIISPPLL